MEELANIINGVRKTQEDKFYHICAELEELVNQATEFEKLVKNDNLWLSAAKEALVILERVENNDLLLSRCDDYEELY